MKDKLFWIGQPINGIAINGLEYLLKDNGETMLFETKRDAEDFLRSYGYDEDLIENYFVIGKD